MRLLRRWKLILGLLAIFVAGVGTGGIGVIMLLLRVFTTPVASQRWTEDRLVDLEKKLKLTPEQKERLAKIHRIYQGKIAEREIFLQQRLAEVQARGELEEAGKIRVQLASERTRLEEERDAEKERVRRA